MSVSINLNWYNQHRSFLHIETATLKVELNSSQGLEDISQLKINLWKFLENLIEIEKNDRLNE